jgi:hypothetical protein
MALRRWHCCKHLPLQCCQKSVLLAIDVYGFGAILTVFSFLLRFLTPLPFQPLFLFQQHLFVSIEIKLPDGCL